MIAPTDTLRAYLERYTTERDVRQSTARGLRYIVGTLEAYLGRVALPDDLTDTTVNGWLAWLASRGLQPETIRSKRRGLLTLWRAIAEERERIPGPARIRRVKVPVRVPSNTWLPADFQKLLAAAELMHGRFRSGVVRADFWRAWILVGYYSGLRLGDLLALRFDQIASDGTLVIVQSKTGQPVWCDLAPALEALDRIALPRRTLVFGSVAGRTVLSAGFRKLVLLAGVRGSTKWLRASGATWIEVHQPGSAMSFLGHRTPGLAYKHYCDPRFIQQAKPRPPKIG